MNFKNAFDKVQAGTASEEEVAFIAEEMEKLHRISELLDNPSASPIVLEAEAKDIEKAKKSYNKKTTIKIIIITFIVLCLIACLVCGIIFIPSLTSAVSNVRHDRDECVQNAEAFISDMTGEDATYFMIKDIDRELRIPDSLWNAIFVYEIDFVDAGGTKYRVEVNSKSGFVILTDKDEP